MLKDGGKDVPSERAQVGIARELVCRLFRGEHVEAIAVMHNADVRIARQQNAATLNQRVRTKALRYYNQ